VYDWRAFLWPADEWLFLFATPPGGLISVKLFSIGHALELYLKAVYAKLTGDVKAAIGLATIFRDSGRLARTLT
jgi:hypothetical protein